MSKSFKNKAKYTLQFTQTQHSKLFQITHPEVVAVGDNGYTFTGDASVLQSTLSGYTAVEPVPSQSIKQAICANIDNAISVLFPSHMGIRMLGTEEAWPHLKMSTSAGIHYPHHTKAEALHYNASDPETIPIANKRARDMFNFVYHSKTPAEDYPNKLAFKHKCYKYTDEPATHPINEQIDQHIETIKGRLIWVAPIETSLFELCYYHPFYQANKHNKFSPMVMGVHTRARVLHYSRNLSCTSVSLDWSQFDQTIPSWISYYIIKRLVDRIEIPANFTNQPIEDYKKHITSQLASIFIHSRVILPDGSTFVKHKGIPSGSQGTQLIGTIANMAIVQYLVHDQNIEAVDLMCLGDDSFFRITSEQYPNLQRMAALAYTHFGMHLHPDKCVVNPPYTLMQFLGYTGQWGFAVVEQQKFEFKQRFLPYPMTLQEEVGRFISLYIMGGYAVKSYAGTRQFLLDSSLLDDPAITTDIANKLQHVYGIDPSALLTNARLILQTDPYLLAQGKLSDREFRLKPDGISQLLQAWPGACRYLVEEENAVINNYD